MNSRRTQRDFRIICDCQRHAGRRRFLRLVRAGGGQLQRRAITLVIGIPLAFCALSFPIDAMNMSLPMLETRLTQIQPAPNQSFHIFTTRKVRQSFLSPEAPVQTFTLEFAKEQFFRTEVPFGLIIYREARRHNLPPELVAAVVEAESDFRPSLVSNKNAQGLMQLVPETGRILGCDNPLNPSDNVAAGVKYLRYLIDRFGDQRTALAAYNAGEGNIERFGGVPPFTETQNYLQRVAQGTRSYKQRIHNRYVASVRMRTALLE
jgi:soluble lytic murein transglycosylase-like protein